MTEPSEDNTAAPVFGANITAAGVLLVSAVVLVGFGMLGPDTEASLWLVFAGVWGFGIGGWFLGRHFSERALARRAARTDNDEWVEQEVARRLEQALAEREQDVTPSANQGTQGLEHALAEREQEGEK